MICTTNGYENGISVLRLGASVTLALAVLLMLLQQLITITIMRMMMTMKRKVTIATPMLNLTKTKLMMIMMMTMMKKMVVVVASLLLLELFMATVAVVAVVCGQHAAHLRSQAALALLSPAASSLGFYIWIFTASIHTTVHYTPSVVLKNVPRQPATPSTTSKHTNSGVTQ